MPNLTKELRKDMAHVIGPVRVELVAGDITKENVDAVATLSNSNLDLFVGGGVGAAIARAGGKSIKRECNKLRPQKPGSVVITSAGSLPSNKVLHLVSASYKPHDVVDIVVKCFKIAESNGISSIAIPAIGTGNASISPKEAAKALLKAIKTFCKTEPSAVNLIRIVVFQEHMLQDFYGAIEDLVKTESTSGGFFSWLKSPIWSSERSTPSSKGSSYAEDEMQHSLESNGSIVHGRMSLKVFASSKHQLDKVEDAIKKEISELSKKKVIEKPAIKELSQAQEGRIKQLQTKYFTEIEVNKRIGRIVVSGISDHVSEAVMEVYEVLKEQAEEKHKRQYAEIINKTVKWYYIQDDDEVAYDDEDIARIEQAFNDKRDSIRIVFIENGKPQEYKINFGSMTEINLVTGEKARVLRRELGTGIPLPSHWEPQPKDSKGKEKDIHLVQLDPNKDKEEYDNVQSAITKTSAINIIEIERVQNPELYRAYMVKKQKMDEKPNGSNEKKLFHGTDVDTCLQINHKGFNISYCGKNATMFGKGVYFARDAYYSMQPRYSPPDSSGKRCMYLASVLVGEYTVGNKSVIAPPQKDANNPTITYDSTVDAVANPGIFVAFHDNQVYPDYLITFQ